MLGMRPPRPWLRMAMRAGREPERVGAMSEGTAWRGHISYARTCAPVQHQGLAESRQGLGAGVAD